MSRSSLPHPYPKWGYFMDDAMMEERETGGLHSRKRAVKLIHVFPSQAGAWLFFPARLATMFGMLIVSSSSTRCKIPLLLRKPMMILGTPRRKDWIQILSNLRSYLTKSLSFSSSAVVFSSTQLIGSSFLSGLRSQTIQKGKKGEKGFSCFAQILCQKGVPRQFFLKKVILIQLTSVHFSPNDQACLAETCLHH